MSLIVIYVQASAAEHITPSGLRARIHSAVELEAWIVDDGDALVFDHPRAGRHELLTGIDDPRLTRADIEAFVPLDASMVAEALDGISDLDLDLTVDIFLLPTPPAEAMGSFSAAGAIYLAPGFGSVSSRTIARLVVHELGHVLTWAYMDQRPETWRRYRLLRGLDPVRNGPLADHRDREREILAEDIRSLFGGDAATSGGGIENPDLTSPDDVVGLKTFLSETLTGRPAAAAAPICRAFPNPCNPRTTIELLLPESADPGAASTMRLSILDLRGRVVARVVGGRFENGRASIDWNGMRTSGGAAASGRYLYLVEVGGDVGRGSITLTR